MSYNAKDALVGKSLELLEIVISGSPALNGYFTFNTQLVSNFSDSISGVSGDTLTLPSGFYWAQAVFAATRTTASHNYQFQFEIDGTIEGKKGQTGWLNNARSDYADAMFENTTGTISLKLKCVDIETSAPTLTTESRFYLWRIVS